MKVQIIIEFKCPKCNEDVIDKDAGVGGMECDPNAHCEYYVDCPNCNTPLTFSDMEDEGW